MKPGTYPSLPMREYLAVPALSAGDLHTLNTECPKAAFYASAFNAANRPAEDEADDPAAQRRKFRGTVCHSMLLEGSDGGVQVFDPSKYPNATGDGVATGWSNKAIKQAKADCIAAGKIPVLKDDMAAIRAMVDSGLEFIESLRADQPDVWQAFQSDNGLSEVSIFWDDDGILCRARPDRLMAVGKRSGLVVHVKTTERSVEPESWSRRIMGNSGYYLTAAWYARAMRHAYGVENARQYFLVGSPDAPYLWSLIGVDPACMAYGEEQLESALLIWRRCVDSKQWPAYPSRAVFTEVPAYEFARWQETNAVNAEGIPYRLEQMFGERKAA